MPDEQANNEQVEELPSTDYILEHWWTTGKAAKFIGMTTHAVTYLCRNDKIRSKNIAGKWYVDPEQAQSYVKKK